VTDQAHRVTWFQPDRPVEGQTVFVRRRRRTTARALPPEDELLAALPGTWRPTPPERRDAMWAFCSRCFRPALLRTGPGDALCDPCARAESWDRFAARPH
jgi:hypothetical protein